MHRLLLLLPLLCCSCIASRIAEVEKALSAGLSTLDQRVDETQADYYAELASLDERVAAGEITVEQYREEAERLDDQRVLTMKSALYQTRDDLKAATEGAIEGIKSDLDTAKATAAQAAVTGTKIAGGVLGMGPLGDLAASALAGALGLNTYRNRKRKLLGEPV